MAPYLQSHVSGIIPLSGEELGYFFSFIEANLGTASPQMMVLNLVFVSFLSAVTIPFI